MASKGASLQAHKSLPCAPLSFAGEIA